MSYPSGRNTGYIFEPWHWRYLGVDEAKEIKNKNLTIQEYLESL
jgi:D-alanyl-D-alanine carboxypeptidase